KAAFPLPSPKAGKITKIRVKEGESVSVGQTLLEIEETGEEASRDGDKKRATPTTDGKKERRPEEEEPRVTASAEPDQRARTSQDAREPTPKPAVAAAVNRGRLPGVLARSCSLVRLRTCGNARFFLFWA